MPFRQSFPYPCVRLQIWHNPFYVWANEGVDIQNYNIGLLYTEYTFSNFPCSDSSSLGETQCSFPRNGKVYSVCGSERHKIDYRVLICWAVLPSCWWLGIWIPHRIVRMMACDMLPTIGLCGFKSWLEANTVPAGVTKAVVPSNATAGWNRWN